MGVGGLDPPGGPLQLNLRGLQAGTLLQSPHMANRKDSSFLCPHYLRHVGHPALPPLLPTAESLFLPQQSCQQAILILWSLQEWTKHWPTVFPAAGDTHPVLQGALRKPIPCGTGGPSWRTFPQGGVCCTQKPAFFKEILLQVPTLPFQTCQSISFKKLKAEFLCKYTMSTGSFVIYVTHKWVMTMRGMSIEDKRYWCKFKSVGERMLKEATKVRPLTGKGPSEQWNGALWGYGFYQTEIMCISAGQK